jgi:hypothetical protein
MDNNKIVIEHETDLYHKGSVSKGLTHIEVDEAKIMVPVEVDLGLADDAQNKAEIHVKFTGEGIIFDLIKDGKVLATSSQMYNELAEEMLGINGDQSVADMRAWNPPGEDEDDDGFCGCDECLGLKPPK